MKTVTFKARFSRRFPDPLNREDQEGMDHIEHHILLCRATEIPSGIPTDPNPRAQKTDKTIYKRVRESLLMESDPTPSFHLKNKGITILAQSLEYLGDKESVEIKFEEGDGIVDGAHTYTIILENQKECSADQYVKIEAITGLPKFMTEPIAEGLNTAVQVQQMSLANLGKKFQWIEETLKDEPYATKIAYKENEDGEFTIREIVSLLTLFNIDRYPDESNHPKVAYISKEKSLEEYLDNEASYKKLRPIVKDILSLYDYIQLHARKLYNEEYKGKGGALAFYQTRKRGKYILTFSEEQTESKLFDGALYPILGAFRFLVEEDPKEHVYRWKIGSLAGVIKFFNKIGGSLIYVTKNTSDNRGKNPNAIGKDDGHWDNLYKTVAYAYVTKK